MFKYEYAKPKIIFGYFWLIRLKVIFGYLWFEISAQAILTKEINKKTNTKQENSSNLCNKTQSHHWGFTPCS